MAINLNPIKAPMAQVPSTAATNPYGIKGRYVNEVTRDINNLNNIADPTQRAAEQNWINEYSGGVWDNPSVRKGRIGYDQRKEISLQNYYKDRLKENAVKNYNNFNVDEYVRGEAGAARKNMARNVLSSQKNIRGNANASGMLFSGRRQMGEALVGQQANQDFQKYQNDLITNALQKKQQLASDVVAPIQAGASADLARLLQSAQMSSANSDAQGRLAGAGLGLIGQGLGNYYGDKNQTLQSPQLKQPVLANNASTYYDNPRV